MSEQAYPADRPASAPVIGNTALDKAPAPTAPPETRKRTPLVLVPAISTKRRTPFVVFCFFTLVAALSSVLVLNVAVSSGQYELVELKESQMALAQENEMLTQQVKNFEAPQNLAATAAGLGMVSSPSSGTIDLQSMSVSGDPKPAKDGDGPNELVPAPDVAIQPETPAEKPVEVPAAPAEAGSAEENAASSEEDSASAAGGATPEADRQDERSGSGEQPSNGGEPGNGGEGQNDGASSGADNIAPQPAEPQAPDLNGGTIPAPQQAGQ